MPTFPEHQRYCWRTNASRLSGQIPVDRYDGQVDHGPAGPAHVKSGVHVLGVGDERRAALRLQRGPPVDGGGPAADGGVEPVTGHLNRPVEHLLDRARGLLDPRLRGAAPEKLGRLHDRHRGIVHVGEGLGQEVAARREVRVEDDQELGGGARERVPQVAGLLVGGQVGPADVAEAEGLRHRADLVGRPVVEDVGLGLSLVVRDEAGDGLPGIAQHLDRLAADRQVDIHAGVGKRLPRLNARLVRGQVEAAAGEVHRQADRLVDDVRAGEEPGTATARGPGARA